MIEHRDDSRILPTVARGLALALALLAIACERSEPRVFGVLGESGSALPTPVGELKASAESPAAVVTTSGTVKRVCPAAGCWIDLEDGGSSIRVELLGFTMTRSEEGRRCLVEGTVVEKAGELKLLARGVRVEP